MRRAAAKTTRRSVFAHLKFLLVSSRVLCATNRLCSTNSYPFDLSEGGLIDAVIELGSADVVGHSGGFFQRAAIFQIRGNAGGADALSSRARIPPAGRSVNTGSGTTS